jgi:hypothetical protein
MSVGAATALVQRAMALHAQEGLEEAADHGDDAALEVLLERAGIGRIVEGGI